MAVTQNSHSSDGAHAVPSAAPLCMLCSQGDKFAFPAFISLPNSRVETRRVM